MKRTLDIELLLQRAAPGKLDSKLSVEQLYFGVEQANRTVDFAGRLAIGMFFLASFLLCLLLMIYCDIPWWLMAVSISSTYLLTAVMWKAIGAVL